MRGWAEEVMWRSLTLFTNLSPAYHGLAALPKRETTPEEGCCHERNKTPRGHLPPGPLFVRARPDAGLLRQYFGQAGRRRLAGDADQCLARLPRSGEAVAARCGRPAPVRRRSDQGSAAAQRAVRNAWRSPRGRPSALDPLGRTVDAAGNRSARGAAADDGLLPDEVRR